MSGNLRDVTRRTRTDERDPTGKAALFTGVTGTRPPVSPTVSAGTHSSEMSTAPLPGTRKPGTLVVECSACSSRTRVDYVEFALLNLPFALWLPLPGRRYNRRMRCPACAEWVWVRASWLE